MFAVDVAMAREDFLVQPYQFDPEGQALQAFQRSECV